MTHTEQTIREMLAAIDAPHFFAGIVLRDDRVIEAADIVRYMRGWSRTRVRDYCARKGWRVSIVRVRKTALKLTLRKAKRPAKSTR
jgi:hypothetical protein